MRVVALVAVAVLALAPGAAAAGYAEVIAKDGRVLADAADGAAFAYPDDGSLVRIGTATVDASGVTLNDVELLGGQVRVDQIDVFGKHVQIGGVAAAGQVVEPRANTLVPLGRLGYLVVDQRARVRDHVGRVALRLVLQQAAFGAPAGAEVLVGLPVSAAPQGRRFDPLSVLGFAGVPAAALGYKPAPIVGVGSIGMQAVALAEQFLGVPYVWGGADPLTGFDCSGLVMYVYGQLGIHLTHYTGSQFLEGLRLPRELLQPGDLVFFDDDPVRGPQHEGIYIGDGRFVQAPHSGDVVTISSLDDPRYGFAYVGAVRPTAR